MQGYSQAAPTISVISGPEVYFYVDPIEAGHAGQGKISGRHIQREINLSVNAAKNEHWKIYVRRENISSGWPHHMDIWLRGANVPGGWVKCRPNDSLLLQGFGSVRNLRLTLRLRQTTPRLNPGMYRTNVVYTIRN
jgi:hypothetical protein